MTDQEATHAAYKLLFLANIAMGIAFPAMALILKYLFGMNDPMGKKIVKLMYVFGTIVLFAGLLGMYALHQVSK